MCHQDRWEPPPGRPSVFERIASSRHGPPDKAFQGVEGPGSPTRPIRLRAQGVDGSPDDRDEKALSINRAISENRIESSGFSDGLEQKVPIHNIAGRRIGPVSAGRLPGIFCPADRKPLVSKVAWLLLCVSRIYRRDCSRRRMKMKADMDIDFPGSCRPLPKGPPAARRRRRKIRGRSNRSCQICGKDPHPNYFYCPACHHRISALGEDDLVNCKGPE
jgi:hypothetical protein